MSGRSPAGCALRSVPGAVALHVAEEIVALDSKATGSRIGLLVGALFGDASDLKFDRLRRRTLLAVKVLVTLAAFAIVVAYVDFDDMAALISSQNPMPVVLAALAVLVQIVLGAFRWRAVLAASANQNAANISAALAIQLYYASIFFNSFLPGTFGGDVVRALSTRALGVTTGASVHSVVLDRVIALVVLCLMALPALPLVWSGIGLGLSETVLIALSGLGATAILLFLLLGRIDRFSSLRAYLERVVISFFVALRNLVANPRELVVALPMAAGAHAAYCIAMYLLAKSIHIDMGIIDALTIVPLILLFSALPISIGGWGVREVGAIGLLGLIGISSQHAVTISLQFGVLSLLVSLPGALFWLGARNRRAVAI